MDDWLEHFARTAFRRSGDTAHDLKTPLNIAVLNLELLRMRLAKLDRADDEKIAAYTSAIETEMRRLARIFDTFFLLSTPPKDEGAPAAVDVGRMARETASASGYELNGSATLVMRSHESRMRQALKMFFEGASKVLLAEGRTATVEREDNWQITISGKPGGADFEVSKIFKFYYTDATGNPDLSLAAARLIVETYGGELKALEERDKVVLRLSLPPGDQ